MTINILEQSLKNKLNAGNPNVISDQLRSLAYGNVLRATVTFLRKKTPVASPYVDPLLEAFVLPDDAKVGGIIQAYGRTGGVAGGQLFVLDTIGAVPASGQIAMAPNGDIVVLAADAWTSVDIMYQPDKYDVVEYTLPVDPLTGVFVLPTPATTAGGVVLMEAEVLVGGSTGKKEILIPQAAAPAAGEAAFNLDKTEVFFAIADAVTSARVKLGVSAAVDVDALLTANASIA